MSEEQTYLDGARSAWIEIMRQAMRELSFQEAISEGGPDKELMQLQLQVARLTLEREGAIRALRSVCQSHGDDDWTNDQSLSDIISKHLHDHLEEA